MAGSLPPAPPRFTNRSLALCGSGPPTWPLKGPHSHLALLLWDPLHPLAIGEPVLFHLLLSVWSSEERPPGFSVMWCPSGCPLSGRGMSSGSLWGAYLAGGPIWPSQIEKCVHPSTQNFSKVSFTPQANIEKKKWHGRADITDGILVGF